MNWSLKFRNLKIGFKNLIKWAPIAWADVDWDYAPLLRVMQFKLENMADYHKNEGITLHKDRTEKQLRIAAALCARILDDEYLIKQFEEQYIEKGGVPFFKVKNESVFRQLILKEHRIRKHDLKELGRLFEKHLLHWWD